MEVILEQKDAADWVYRGEGAANLVLAYTGSSPTFMGKVMRLKKAPRNGSPRIRSPTALTTHERLLWKDLEDIVSSSNKELAGQLFVEHIMSPLLGSKHVDAGRRVLVTREFLESVEKNVICQRPAWRVDAAKVDTSSDSVLLLSDHSLFSHGIPVGEPCISVEIKPKCGFLPFSNFIDEGNAIKRSITRFRMHQALKLHQGEISEYSEYDPIDLFSQSKDRILKALMNLFTTPQNNFRVFFNGTLIFGALGGTAGSTNCMIGEAFEDALKGVILGDHGMRTRSFLQLIAETVYKSGIMYRLLEVQKLDTFDIEGAIHAYYDIISEPCMVCRELGEEKVLHRYKSLHSKSLDESLKIVKDFLIAATAKDCSLMISFRPGKEGNSGSSCNSVYLESTNQTFDYKVYFIDLDLKPLKKMEEYYELDKKIVSCYSKMMEAEERAGKATSMEEKSLHHFLCGHHGVHSFPSDGPYINIRFALSVCWFKSSTLILNYGGVTLQLLDKALYFRTWFNDFGKYPPWVLADWSKLGVTFLYFIKIMAKKTVLSVELLCSKCRQKVMKLIAMLEGITSIVLDPSKNTVTVIGEADPVKIINKVRKFRKSATILSIGPPKDEKKDEKKDAYLYTPKACQRCDVWYVINDYPYPYCSIM
ncbi:hypothetical protein FNV43_RR11529 [Rhamnella rubrinervis]|uniref:inositol-pentakisphosphate 2-kinase n=1 Tax=Rhamnella rubrinervis TaxID=2594499 RepID=A0A8K0H623_9ROSA|nr:hypothetical protein FNV43_RR11529 [Rhamnella rubrinervis]